MQKTKKDNFSESKYKQSSCKSSTPSSDREKIHFPNIYLEASACITKLVNKKAYSIRFNLKKEFARKEAKLSFLNNELDHKDKHIKCLKYKTSEMTKQLAQAINNNDFYLKIIADQNLKLEENTRKQHYLENRLSEKTKELVEMSKTLTDIHELQLNNGKLLSEIEELKGKNSHLKLVWESEKRELLKLRLDDINLISKLKQDATVLTNSQSSSIALNSIEHVQGFHETTAHPVRLHPVIDPESMKQQIKVSNSQLQPLNQPQLPRSLKGKDPEIQPEQICDQITNTSHERDQQATFESKVQSLILTSKIEKTEIEFKKFSQNMKLELEALTKKHNKIIICKYEGGKENRNKRKKLINEINSRLNTLQHDLTKWKLFHDENQVQISSVLGPDKSLILTKMLQFLINEHTKFRKELESSQNL